MLSLKYCKVCRIGAYEERKGKKERTERRRKEGAE